MLLLCHHFAVLSPGIVQGTATVRGVERSGADFACFDIELPTARADNVQIGASVAINGTCLTVVAQEGATLRFDVMGETLRRTNLGGLDVGSAVNFERSARVGDEIGGHTVSGHVHTTARIVDVQDSENNKRVVFEVGGNAGGWHVLVSAGQLVLRCTGHGSLAGGLAGRFGNVGRARSASQACCRVHLVRINACPLPRPSQVLVALPRCRAAARLPGTCTLGARPTTQHSAAAKPPAVPPLPTLQLADPSWMKYILPKGFVSVDGCSLTVGEVTDATFSVYLIPETLRWAGRARSHGAPLPWLALRRCGRQRP